MIAYIFKSSLCLILLFGLYWLMLRKEKLFVFNRIFLVASIVFSLIVPFISIPVIIQNSRIENIIPSYNGIGIPVIPENHFSNSLFNTASSVQRESRLIDIPIAFFIYIGGVLLLLIRFLRNLHTVDRRIRSSEEIGFKGFRILLTDELIGPCCFLNAIFLNKSDYLDGRIDKDLLDHEMEHARQSHTIDILLIELVKIFYWFNPVILLYDRAIRINHEFLADNRVITNNPDIKSYADKLLSFINSSTMSLTSGSTNSFTRMRIIMMMKTQSGKLKHGTRIAGTLCFVVILFILLSFKSSEYKSSAAGLTLDEIQQNTVKGIVVTEDGRALTEATIKIDGVNDSIKSGTFADGRFILRNVQPGALLDIERQGFKRQKVKADFSSAMTIRMVRDPDYKGKVFIAEVNTVNFRNSDFTPANGIVVIDGVILGEDDILKISPSDIKSFSILNSNDAVKKYGRKANDGALEIVLSGDKSMSVSDSDSSKYMTSITFNKRANKGELLDVPVTNLQYASVYTFHDLDGKSSKEMRIIHLVTRDYYQVNGKVTAKNQRPLAGVRISASDNISAVISDRNGNFSIRDVREGALLEFSLPGYKPFYLSTLFDVAFNESMNIELQKD